MDAEVADFAAHWESKPQKEGISAYSSFCMVILSSRNSIAQIAGWISPLRF